MHRWYLISTVLLFCLCPWLSVNAQPNNASIEAVVDRAGVLSAEQKTQLKLKLLALFNKSKVQLAILIVKGYVQTETAPSFDFQPHSSINDASAKAVILLSSETKQIRWLSDAAFDQKLAREEQRRINRLIEYQLEQGNYFKALDEAIDQVSAPILGASFKRQLADASDWMLTYIAMLLLWIGLSLGIAWQAYQRQKSFMHNLPQLSLATQIEIGIYLTTEAGFPNINPQPKARLLYEAEQMPQEQLAALARDLIRRHYAAEKSFSYSHAPWLLSLFSGLTAFVLLVLGLAYWLKENPFSIFLVTWAPFFLFSAALYYYGRASVHQRFEPRIEDAYLLLLGKDSQAIDEISKRNRFTAPMRPEKFNEIDNN